MYTIAVIAGDGIGPEVIEEGIKVLTCAFELFSIKHEFIYYPFGGEYYLKNKEVIPSSAISELKQVSAIYLGAVGHPDVPEGILERELLLRLRFELDQYINLRPVKLYPNIDTPLKNVSPQDVDFVVVRENTECLYVGVGGFLKRGTVDEVAFESAIYTYKGTRRCIEYAYNLALSRRKKLTLCHKANVLTYGHNLWRRVFDEVHKDFFSVERDYAYVDALSMWLITTPQNYDVIVTCNMFGDIITDLAAVLQGGLGVAPAANINPNGVSMFEPIHGSAPKYAGKQCVCPLAAILAGVLMLNNIGLPHVAKKIEQAIVTFLSSGRLRSTQAGEMGLLTSEVGDAIVEILRQSHL